MCFQHAFVILIVNDVLILIKADVFFFVYVLILLSDR